MKSDDQGYGTGYDPRKELINMSNIPIMPYYDDEEPIEQYTDNIDFKKIKKVRWTDESVKDIKFKDWKELYEFETVTDAMFEADYGFSYILYRYLRMYKIVPAYLVLTNGVLPSRFFDTFRKKLNVPLNCMDFNSRFDNKSTDIGHFYIHMEKMILYFDGHSSFLVYDPEEYQKSESVLHTVLGLIKSYKTPNVIKNTLYVVYKTEHGFQKKPFKVKKKKIDLGDNYNDDFPAVSEDIIRKLNNMDKTGLVILHGEPGTGKTTYIRYLAGKLKRDIIFISPDMVHHITSPDFIPFLMDNSNAILIIEDAEPALQKREGDGRSGAVSNILNMTDGLLSDCLNISIVATFNTKMNNVDEALRRQGRLLREYQFDKLDVHKAQSLMDKTGKDVKVTEPMSLAEIYFYGDENTDGRAFQRKKVGFGN